MHFDFRKDSCGKIDKSKHAVCKLCNALVAHGGGTTNLQNHLHLTHCSEYLLLYPAEETGSSSKVNATQTRMKEFISVPKLPDALIRTKMLAETIADCILEDMS